MYIGDQGEDYGMAGDALGEGGGREGGRESRGKGEQRATALDKK